MNTPLHFISRGQGNPARLAGESWLSTRCSEPKCQQVAIPARPKTWPIPARQHRPISTPTRTDSGSGPSVVAQISPIGMRQRRGGHHGAGRLCATYGWVEDNTTQGHARHSTGGWPAWPVPGGNPRGRQCWPWGAPYEWCVPYVRGGLGPDRAFSVPHTAESARQPQCPHNQRARTAIPSVWR